MCLGIPGRVVELGGSGEHLARVEVTGVGRVVNVALLEGEPLAVGDWVLVHVGFALARIDEEEAAATLAALEVLGRAYEEELEAFSSPPVEREGR